MTIFNCSYCGAESDYRRRGGKGLCGKHLRQLQKHGKYGPSWYDPHEVKTEGEVSSIEIMQNGKAYQCKFDTADIPTIIAHRWAISDGYARNYTIKMYMHVLLLGKEKRPGQVIDHINRDKLDNRRSNLRIVSYSENTLNSGRFLKTDEGYKEARKL